MAFLSFIWAVVANWQVLAALAAVAVVAAGYAYFRGLPALLKIVLDLRTWLVVGFVVLVLAVSSLQKKNEVLNDKLDNAEQVEISKTDASKTLTKRLKAKDVRAAESQRLEEAITNAEPEEAVDDLLDEIAALQSGRPAVDRQPGPDGVRHPDGTIEP